MTSSLPALVLVVALFTGLLAWLVGVVLAAVGLARVVVAAWRAAVATAARRL